MPTLWLGAPRKRYRCRSANRRRTTPGTITFGARYSSALVGRIDEARAAVEETLALYPDMNIERYARNQTGPKVGEETLIDAMRKAGFPACANEKALRNRPDIKRLP